MNFLLASTLSNVLTSLQENLKMTHSLEKPSNMIFLLLLSCYCTRCRWVMPMVYSVYSTPPTIKIQEDMNWSMQYFKNNVDAVAISYNDKFLCSSNVINHMYTCMNLSTPTIPEHCTSLLPTSATYKYILLEVCSLVPTIADYNEFILQSSLSIFASPRSGKLPIVYCNWHWCIVFHQSTPSGFHWSSLYSWYTFPW